MRLVRLTRVSKGAEEPGQVVPVNVDRVLWMLPWGSGGGTTLFFGSDRMFVKESVEAIERQVRRGDRPCDLCGGMLQAWDTDSELCNDCRLQVFEEV